MYKPNLNDKRVKLYMKIVITIINQEIIKFIIQRPNEVSRVKLSQDILSWVCFIEKSSIILIINKALKISSHNLNPESDTLLIGFFLFFT